MHISSLQTNLNEIQLRFKEWHMKVNETKSVQVTFTLKQNTCPPVQLNNKQLTQPDDVKYLVYIWVENLPGVNTYLQRENNWLSDYANGGSEGDKK